MQVNVISKGKKPRYFDNFATVRQYIVIKENGKKYLLVKISNDRKDTLTAVKVAVKQMNARGESVGIVEREFNGISIKYRSRFVPEQKIELAPDTVTVDVRVADAFYGDNKLSAKGQTIVSTYEKKEDHEELTKREINNLSGGKKFATKPRHFRIPKAFTVFTVALVLAMFAVTAVKVFDFSKKSKSFILSQVQYEFIDGDKSAGSPIRLSGFKGSPSKVVVPEKIEGHPVVEIEASAFVGNKSVKTLTIKGAPVIGESAFKSCSALTTVNLGNTTVVGASAFESCPLLTSVTATGLETVGASAFRDCATLTTINVSNDEKVLTLGDTAFDLCPAVKEIYINQPLSYESGSNWFASSAIVEKIELYNFNETEFDSLGGASRQFVNFFGEGAIPPQETLTSLKISKMDAMPQGFMAGYSALTEFSVGEFDSAVLLDDTFSGCTSLTTLDIPVTFTAVGARALAGTQITEFDCSKLVSIGESAFNGASKLTTTYLTNNKALISLGAYAFKGCSELKMIHIPSQITTLPNYVFADCSALTSVNFAKDTSVTEIGEGAFSGVSSLAAISLPYQLTHIKDKAFSGCSSLISISFHNYLTEIHDGAFENCSRLTAFSVPENVHYLGLGVIAGCSSLEELTVPFIGETESTENRINFLFGATEKDATGNVPASLKTIEVTKQIVSLPDYAFFDCVGLQSAVLDIKKEDEQNVIGEYAYGNCYALPVLPDFDGIEVVGKYAFSGCTSLTEAYIPSTLVSVGDGILAGCTALTSFAVDSFRVTASTSELPVDNFGKLFGSPEPDQNKNFIPSSIATVNVKSREIADNTIPDNAFYGFTGATSFVLPESVTVERLGNNAFRDCALLSYIPYKDTLVSIGSGAFAYCTAFTSVSVTRLDTTIGSGAFAGCEAITNMVLPFVATGQPIGYLFGGTNLTVPQTLTSVTLLNQTAVCEGMFSGCSKIKSVSLYDGLSSIGAVAFDKCSSLEKIVIPSSVQTIGAQAFNECYRLFEVIDLRAGSTLTYNNYDTVSGLGQYAISVFHNEGQSLTRDVVSGGYVIAKGQRGNYIIDYDKAVTDLVFPEYSETYKVVWRLLENNNTVKSVNLGHSVTDIEDYAFRACTSIESVVAGTSLSRLGTQTFENCTSLSSANFAFAQITTVPSATFYACVTLSTVNLPTCVGAIGSQAFYYNRALSSINLPDGITVIGDGAFDNCSSLATADMPASLRTVGARAFYGSALQAVVFEESTNLSSIGTEAFANNDKLHSVRFAKTGNLTLYDKAFYNSALRSLEIPSSVKITGSQVFANCNSLTSVDSYSSTLGVQTFANCGTLATVTVRNSNVSQAMFNGCNALEKVDIQNSVIGANTFAGRTILKKAWITNSTINANAFANCTALRSVRMTGNISVDNTAFMGDYGILEVYDLSASLTIEKGTDNYGGVAQYAIIVHHDANAEELQDVTVDNFNYRKSDAFWYLYGYNSLPSELTINKIQGIYDVIIAPDVFKDSPLTKLTLNGVKEVGENAFRNCSTLTSVTLGSSVRTVGENAFYNCYSLRTVTLGSGVQSVGNNAFTSCNKLYEVYNLSALNVGVGYGTHGDVARYALIVNDSLSDPAIEYYSHQEGDFVYDFFYLPGSSITPLKGSTWYLERCRQYFNDSVTLPINISTNTSRGTINSYVVRNGAFNTTYNVNMVIPVGVTLKDASFNSGGLGTVYYTGNSSDWDDYMSEFVSKYSYVYYYQDCFHVSGLGAWRYDVNGYITTSPVQAYEYQLKETINSTCVKEGKRIYTCPNANCSQTREEVINRTSHVMENGACKTCGHSVVTDFDEVSGLYSITNGSANPFKFAGNGGIVITPPEDSADTVSELTISLSVPCRISFNYSVSNGSYGQLYIGGYPKAWAGSYDEICDSELVIVFNFMEGTVLEITDLIIADLE